MVLIVLSEGVMVFVFEHFARVSKSSLRRLQPDGCSHSVSFPALGLASLHKPVHLSDSLQTAKSFPSPCNKHSDPGEAAGPATYPTTKKTLELSPAF